MGTLHIGVTCVKRIARKWNLDETSMPNYRFAPLPNFDSEGKRQGVLKGGQDVYSETFDLQVHVNWIL